MKRFILAWLGLDNICKYISKIYEVIGAVCRVHLRLKKRVDKLDSYREYHTKIHDVQSDVHKVHLEMIYTLQNRVDAIEETIVDLHHNVERVEPKNSKCDCVMGVEVDVDDQLDLVRKSRAHNSAEHMFVYCPDCGAKI